MLLKYKPKKELGQNFLTNRETALTMVNSLKNNNKNIVEIGGGYGVLSELVISKLDINNLYIYEYDERLSKLLGKKFNSNDKVDVIFDNFLDSDLSEYQNYQVFGAIPYNITSPIIHKLLREQNSPSQITLLIQKEVGDKLIAEAPKSNYWTYITLGYDIKKITNVSKFDFNPVPKVESCIIQLNINLDKKNILNQIGFVKWSKFLHHVYKTPRKMLNKRFSNEQLTNTQIDNNLRPQNLTLKNLIDLYNELNQTKIKI